MKNNSRINILGIGVNVTSYDQAVEEAFGMIRKKGRHYICVASTQDVVIAQNDMRFKRIINNADLVTSDGWPVVWAIKLCGGNQKGRVTGPDLMLNICKESVKSGFSHYFFGAAQGVPDLLATKLKEKYPGLIVKGVYSPPFKAEISQEKDDTLKMLNNSGADILWVGLSTPKQQYWIEANIGLLNIPLVIAVGAAFDFHSGKIKRAPVWMQKCGLEWFHRLCQEPRRLWKRYLKFLPAFALLFLGQLLGIKRYTTD